MIYKNFTLLLSRREKDNPLRESTNSTQRAPLSYLGEGPGVRSTMRGIN